MKRIITYLVMRYGLIILLLWTSAIKMDAQVSALVLQQELEKQVTGNYLRLYSPPQTSTFYKARHYEMAWITNGAARGQLLQFVQHAEELGLRQADYRYPLMDSLCSGTKQLKGTNDSLHAEFLLTDAAIHFFYEVAYGTRPPEISYNGLNYAPSCLDVPNLLSASLSSNAFSGFLKLIECKSPEYLRLKVYLAMFNKMSETDHVAEGNITSSKIDASNRPLIEKLFQLQLIDTAGSLTTAKNIKASVLAAQKLFALPENGVLTSTLIRQLNVRPADRIDALKRAINTTRWLRCMREQKALDVIVVNIPSASLFVFNGNSVVMTSRVIVGKPSTRTPIFAAEVNEVVMYPYWMVPKSIAIKELLPHIKRNANYLDENGFQVVDLQGRVINAATINWHALHAGYFPYILRQSTGCDNSLGLVKLNFYNPFSVYLHDTPTKPLFRANRRFFSHGCIRVEKAMQLARLVLKDNTIAVDSIEEKGCLRNQKPISVKASAAVPLFVLYNTAWVDSTGAVAFSDDVYKRFAQAKR